MSCMERKEEMVFVTLTIQLHVDLLAGAGHITTNCELIFHFPKSSGQGRLFPASDLPSGF